MALSFSMFLLNKDFVFVNSNQSKVYSLIIYTLDSQSNGLSYLIDKLKGQKLYSHITLKKGERSDLANLANELL